MFHINKPIGLLFTKDKKYYTDKNEQVIWNYFFTKNLDECIKFITLYQPKTILIDTSVDHETIIGCIAKIKHTYTYTPITIFAKKESIAEIIETKSADSVISFKTNKYIEIPIEIEKKLDYALAELKFSPSLKGYNFIKRCLFEGCLNSTMFENIEKCLYNQVADIYNTSKYSIERGINFSIRRAYSENPTGFYKYVNDQNKPPSNGKFLKTMLVYLKYLKSTPKVHHKFLNCQ